MHRSGSGKTSLQVADIPLNKGFHALLTEMNGSCALARHDLPNHVRQTLARMEPCFFGVFLQ